MSERVVASACGVISAAVVAVLAGCSSSPPGPGNVSDLPESSLVEGAYAYPTEAMEPDPIFAEAQYNAIRQAIASCMADRGFEYEYRQYRSSPPGRYGVTDPEQAATWGFRNPASFGGEQDDPDAPPPPQNPQMSPEEEAWTEALSGTEEHEVAVTGDSGQVVEQYRADGCSAQGPLSVNPHYFEQRALLQMLLDLHGRASREVEQEPEFQKAFEEWNRCYSEAGPGPVESLDDYWAGGGLPPDVRTSETISQEEIDAAVASATCLHESGFLRTWSGMLALAEQRLLDENPGILTEYLEIQQNVREELGV